MCVSGVFPILKYNEYICLMGMNILSQCGQELGETLLNLSRALELGDASTSHSLVKKLPLIEPKLAGSAKSGKPMRK